MNLHPSKGIEDIASRAMLVSLNISQFSAMKTDKKITAEVAVAHGADVNMGRYAKSVIEKKSLDKLRRLAGEIRSEHYRRTLPWSEDGARILTSSGYQEYTAFMRKSSDAWDSEVSEFLDGWQSFVSDARVKLNGMFNPADYPPIEKVAAKFRFRTSVKPVPVADDFRVALGANEVSSIRAELESSMADTVELAMQAVWTQMRDVVAKMAERLKAYNPAKPGDAPFRETLVTNITELLEVLPSLNLTNDANVARFTDSIRDLVQFDAQALRDNQWKRDDTAKRADAILADMSAFIS